MPLTFSQQKAHPGKVTQSEEEATKDPLIRKSIKEAAAEVEKSEGRGQLKVTSRTSDTEVKDPDEYLIHLKVGHTLSLSFHFLGDF